MECQRQLGHSDCMTQHVDQSAVSNASLGQRARGRAPVDLLLEAARLNFSASEIAELARLYSADIQSDEAKKPQKAA